MSSNDFCSNFFILCAHYNVVLIGDSRVGKSTFIESLQMRELSDSDSPYRGTILPDVKCLYFEDKDNITSKSNIMLNILDTPGLDEIPIDGVSRPNEELQDIISNHIKENFSNIDLILIVIQNKGITDKVMKSIYNIKEYFGNKYLRNMCLLITHCDEYDEKKEKDHLEKLKENEEMRDIVNAIDDRVLFTGKNPSEGTMSKNISFFNEQLRRRNIFLKTLDNSQEINLKKTANLNDLRPIDVLESAASTNNTILNLPRENKKDEEEIMFFLDKMMKLNLEDEMATYRNEFVDSVKEFFENNKVIEVDSEEISSAKKYNEVEIPLKRTAEQLKLHSFKLKTQLNIVRTAYNSCKLDEKIIKTPEKQKINPSDIVTRKPKPNKKK